KDLSLNRWEYPIPKSKEYWEKFCHDEERRLVIVRTPLKELSYHSLCKTDSDSINFNTRFDNEVSDSNSFSNSYVDERKVSESSLHKFCPIRSKSKVKKDRHDGRGSLPKPILKSPVLAPAKIPDTTCNLATSSKVVRIPKLDTLGPQPSSETKDFKFKDRSRKDIATGEREKSTVNQPVTRETKKGRQTVTTDEESLKYSVRFAYKALKQLTKNKDVDFNPARIENLQRKLLREGSNDRFISDEEKECPFEAKNTEENERKEGSMYVGDTQRVSARKSVEDSKFTRIGVRHATLESEETMSRTIATESRYTSASSPEFVYPENFESPSSGILKSIPKFSSYPRKNRDRCLPCMLKSFETPVERKTSLPRTTLQRIVDRERTKVASSKHPSEGSDSSSASVPSFENELERMSSFEVETGELSFDEKYNISESRVVTDAASSSQENRQRVTSTVEQKCVSDSEISCKTITEKIKGSERDDDSPGKNFKDTVASSTKSVSLERTKLSSVQGESSEEDDSMSVSISEDQPKHKYYVPCHVPTVFKPSLEPLRALRNRIPTTLQDRIAMLESSSAKKSGSIDDHDDVSEKPRSVPKGGGVLDTERMKIDEKPVPPLTRAKSVSERLTLEKAEAGVEKQRHVLKKGTSLSCFLVSTSTAFNKSEIYRDASEDALRESDSTLDDGFLKTLHSGEFPPASTKLPLTCSSEILEIFENLEEDTSSTGMLEILCKEFSERLSDGIANEKSKDKERREMVTRLTRLLVDSKRYLYPDKFPSDLLFSTTQPPPCNSRLLRRIFPLKTYNLVAPVLGMPEFYPKKEAAFDTTFQASDLIDGRRYTDETEPHDSLIVHPATSRGTETLGDEEKVGHRRYNPYALFLMKPRRKVVTWRPLTKRDLEGYDPDATLEMRADRTMKKICQDFCRWIESLGGTENVIDEEVLRDMFEIDFSAEACRATQVLIQEMPVVPAEVALTRNSPSASKLAMTKKHVMKDAKAEKTAAKTKAFGTSIPWHLQFVPPNNEVEKRWLRCENVPRDVESMDVVWKDITHLKSVTGFVEWLQQHPEVPQPEALKKMASMDIRTLRQTEDDETFAHLELDINQIKSLRVGVDDDSATS
ncbi:hypothetical protein WH47_04454, partial [Habropoda laboriosa]